jgi:hypothetical protein
VGSSCHPHAACRRQAHAARHGCGFRGLQGFKGARPSHPSTWGGAAGWVGGVAGQSCDAAPWRTPWAFLVSSCVCLSRFASLCGGLLAACCLWMRLRL